MSRPRPPMAKVSVNKNLWLLAVCQGLFLTNNVTLIAINGLVGLALAPRAWMATLPVMGYVVGGALSTGIVARTQQRFGRRTSFQSGLVVALASALLCAYAAWSRNFWLLCFATVVAGYYNANAGLYRFAAAELTPAAGREKAVSLVMAGGLLGAVLGPNLAARTRDLSAVPFVGAYVALAVVALLAMGLMAFMRFPPAPPSLAFFGDNACRRALCAESPRCCQTWTEGCDGALLRIAYMTDKQSAKTGRCYYHDRATCPTCACAYYVKVDAQGFDGGTGCLQSREATVANLLEACGLGRCG